MTPHQKAAIDRMTESQLRKQLSIMIGTSNDSNIIDYIEMRLEHLNVDNALAVNTDMNDFGDLD